MELYGYTSPLSLVRCGVCSKDYKNIQQQPEDTHDQHQKQKVRHRNGHVNKLYQDVYGNSVGNASTGTISNMFCASCISYKMLKHKLNLITLEEFNKRSSAEVSKILQECMNGNSASFIKDYLTEKEHNNVEDNSADAEIEGPKVVNGVPIPAKGSVFRLAHMLLNVEISTLSNRLSTVKSKIEQEQNKQDQVRFKIAQLRTKIEDRKKSLKESTSLMKQTTDQSISRLESDIKYLESEKLQNIQKILQSTRLKLATDNANILAVTRLTFQDEQHITRKISQQDLNKRTDEYLHRFNQNLANNISKTKAQRVSDFKVAIGFLPVLSITDYFKYSSQLINSSLSQVSQLAESLAFSLGIELSFPIYTLPSNEEINFLNSQTGKNFEPFKAVIGVFNSNHPELMFALHIANSIKSNNETFSLCEIDSGQLEDFSMALARLIVDLLLILKNLSTDGNILFDEGTKLENLLHLDQLVDTIVFQVLFNKRSGSSNSTLNSSERSSVRSISVSSDRNANADNNAKVNRKISFSETVMNFWNRNKKENDQNLTNRELGNQNDDNYSVDNEKDSDKQSDLKEQLHEIEQFNLDYYYNLFNSERIDLTKVHSESGLLASIEASVNSQNNNNNLTHTPRSTSPDIVNISNSTGSQSFIKMKNKLHLGLTDTSGSIIGNPSKFKFSSEELWNVDLLGTKIFEFFAYEITRTAESMDIFKMSNTSTITPTEEHLDKSNSTITGLQSSQSSEEIKYGTSNGATGFYISPKTKNSMALSSANVNMSSGIGGTVVNYMPRKSNTASNSNSSNTISRNSSSTSILASDSSTSTSASASRHKNAHHYHHHHHQDGSPHHISHHHTPGSNSNMSMATQTASRSYSQTQSQSQMPSPTHLKASHGHSRGTTRKESRLSSPSKARKPVDEYWEVI